MFNLIFQVRITIGVWAVGSLTLICINPDLKYGVNCCAECKTQQDFFQVYNIG